MHYWIAILVMPSKAQRHSSVLFVADCGERRSFNHVLAEAQEEKSLNITFFLKELDEGDVAT